MWPRAPLKGESMEVYMNRHGLTNVAEVYGDGTPNIVSLAFGHPFVCQRCDHMVESGKDWVDCLHCGMSRCCNCQPALCSPKMIESLAPHEQGDCTTKIYNVDSPPGGLQIIYSRSYMAQ